MGPTSLATYNICLQFAQLSHTLLAAGLQVIVPSVSRSLGAGNVELLSRHGMGGAAWAATACLVVPALIAILTPDILTHWISPAFANQNTDLALLLLMGFAVLCVSIPAHFMLIGLGEIRFVSQLNLFAGCVCAVLLLVLDLTELLEFAAVRMVYGVLLLTAWWRLYQKLHFLTRSVKNG
jgi:Na+-driven multidrug efflux pump